MAKGFIAYAAVYSNGNVAEWSVRPYRKDALEAAVRGMMSARDYERFATDSDRWSYCYRRGARIIRVTVTPTPGDSRA